MSLVAQYAAVGSVAGVAGSKCVLFESKQVLIVWIHRVLPFSPPLGSPFTGNVRARHLRINNCVLFLSSSVCALPSAVDTEPLSNLSLHSSSSSPENSDDFVLVPKNLPTDVGTANYERK